MKEPKENLVTTNFKKEQSNFKECKLCKKKRWKNLKVCFAHHIAKEKEKRLAKVARKKERKERNKEKKANSPKRLKAELDRVFSLYIRRRASDPQGRILCVCCYTLLPWQEAQNMHYVGRVNMNTRWDERNCWPGCMRCNVFKNGNYPAYTQYLLNTYGQEWLQELINDGKKVKQWCVEELKELIKKYQELLSQL